MRTGQLLLRAIAWLVPALLAACGSAPPRSPPSGPLGVVRPAPGAADRDGPEANPPADLASVPDAEPRIEPIRVGGPNKPYEALGRGYVPVLEDRPFTERGLASWYGRKFHGRRTANGEVYDMYAMTAAHPTLPIPSYARVRNPANGREVVVRVNDRGPFHSGRIVDLSYTAALKLGVLHGVTPVELSRITFEDIRTGSWRKAPTEAAPADRPPVMLAAAAVAVEPESAPPLPPALPAPLPGPLESDPLPAEKASAPEVRSAAGFWVQLGVFKQREGAETFHRRVAADVDWLAPLLAVFSDTKVSRLQSGPYASRSEAEGVAARVKEVLRLVPVIVERRR
jgi:rare lipoprotein A